METWYQFAACADNPEPFWKLDRNVGRSPKEDLDKARQVCHGCLVESDCLTFGVEKIATAALSGMWGGKTYEERRELKRGKRARAAPKPKAAQKQHSDPTIVGAPEDTLSAAGEQSLASVVSLVVDLPVETSQDTSQSLE